MALTLPLPAQDMIEQQQALKKLLDRNAGRNAPTASGSTQLFLPFILVQVGLGGRQRARVVDTQPGPQSWLVHLLGAYVA